MMINVTCSNLLTIPNGLILWSCALRSGIVTFLQVDHVADCVFSSISCTGNRFIDCPSFHKGTVTPLPKSRGLIKAWKLNYFPASSSSSSCTVRTNKISVVIH